MPRRPLHVAVDGRELLGRTTGVGRYVREILSAWAARADGDRISVVLPASPPPELGHLPVEWAIAPGPRAGTWWEQTALARTLRRLAPDVLFAPGYTAPLRARVPVLLTVHDVSFFAHPEWFPTREGLRRRWLTRAAARRAAIVTTVSEFSKAEIVRWLGLAPERILVAPNGVPELQSEVSDDSPPVVLFVGSLFNRRRIPDLIAGFARTAAQVSGARLVLVGDNRTSPVEDPLSHARRLGVGDRVEWHAWIDDERLREQYSRARVFAFLSDYEGFGLTPFEAIAAGVPAVVLDTPLSREVYGPGARLVAPDPEAIGNALTRLLTDRDEHRAQLEAGRRRLARYSWARTADILHDALARAATLHAA